MRAIFRTDASTEIGLGHLMRCLALAEYLRSMDTDCQFVCRSRKIELLKLISDRGFPLKVLINKEFSESLPQENIAQGLAHAHWLDCDWRVDAHQTGEILKPLKPDWLVVDHYALDSSWERKQRPYVGRILVIDDLVDRTHDCDLLLDQNLGSNQKDYIDLVPKHAQILVGPEYALLRPEFSAHRPYSLQRRNNSKLRKLLISMGGMDPQNATGKVLEALKSCTLPDNCCISIVLGQHAPWLESVQQQAKTLSCRTEVLVNIIDMASQLADSDLAIGAAGISSWERCCLGVPSLVVILAENQRSAALQLTKAGIAQLLDIDDSLSKTMNSHLESLQKNPDKLTQMSKKAMRVTRGQGARLLAERMTKWSNP